MAVPLCLRVSTRDVHPQLGHGVLFLLILPTNFSEEESNRLALDFNREELQSFTRLRVYSGSWKPEFNRFEAQF
jgi:hypothetical protein